MSSPNEKASRGGRLVDLLDDPEAARLVTRMLESYRDIAQRMGGARPIIEALSESIVLTGDPDERAEYDRLRRELIGYARALDDSAVARADRAAGSEPELTPSPEVTGDQVAAAVELLLGAVVRRRG